MRSETNWENRGDGVPAPDRATDLLAAVKLVLRPLVKAMIARGVTLPALVDALKETFVEVAENDFELDGKRSTDSRVSILTGVHRKDVRALRSAEASEKPRQRALGVGATVVGRWLGDPDFLLDDGKPRPLARQTGASDAPSFETLVERVSKDVRPRTILDELLRLGLVEHRAEDDSVSLVTDAFVPRQGEQDMLHFFKMNLHDHTAAAVENLLAGDESAPFLERVVYYSHLTPGSVDALEAEARELATEALIRLNKSALARQRADVAEASAHERFRFGAFFYREDVGGEDSAIDAEVGSASTDDTNQDTAETRR